MKMVIYLLLLYWYNNNNNRQIANAQCLCVCLPLKLFKELNTAEAHHLSAESGVFPICAAKNANNSIFSTSLSDHICCNLQLFIYDFSAFKNLNLESLIRNQSFNNYFSYWSQFYMFIEETCCIAVH